MSGNLKEFLSELSRRVGKGKVLTDPEDLYSYSLDASTEFKQPPAVVVRASGEEDVRAVLELADRYRVPVVPRGSGTSLTGGSVPTAPNTILLDLTPMNKIEVNIDDGYVMAEAGATVLEIDKACRQYGFFFPPDPASSRIATIGGSIAENAGGLRGAKFGVMKNWILAMEVVLPGGKRLRIGEPVYKWRWGPDLMSLFVGSEGTLGVITKAWLKVYPLPEKVVRVLGVFDRIEDAGKAIAQVRRRGYVPMILELLDRETIEIVNESLGYGIEVAEAMVMADVDGPRESVWRIAREVESVMKESGGRTSASDDPVEMERLYMARQGAYAAVTRAYPGVLLEDITVPLSKLMIALRELDRMRKEYGLRVPVFGHAGDGNLHPIICFDPRDSEQLRKARELFLKTGELAIKLGGAISGEHGIGLAKKELFLEEIKAVRGEGYIEMVRMIKNMVDPNGIMNPGKIVF
ncbi:MAG: FAD-binding protein [Candidatus Korarchaeum sp.]|nr:FAD-binding protein [Candidatus Korarchaeum sp.]MDW8035967.1 FAD-linked oxidase C-terminal domain-containing protein [Candidatus Korarchaeum sp.]